MLQELSAILSLFHNFLIDAKGDVPWLKMSFGKIAAYGECCELPILKKISAVSVPPRVPILLHTDYQRTDSCFLL